MSGSTWRSVRGAAGCRSRFLGVLGLVKKHGPTVVEDAFPAGTPTNIGILLGAPSRNLTDIDLDCPETVALADTFLPATACRFGRASKLGSHRLYTSEISSKTFTEVDDKKTMLVEIRSTGRQTMAPPSVHTFGEAVEWESNGTPAAVTAETLRRSVTHLAIAALLSRHWPKTAGSRDEIAMAAAGLLLRAGLGVDLVDRILVSAARTAGDEDAADRAKAQGTSEALTAGEPVTGGPRLAELLILSLRDSPLDRDVLALCVAEISQPLGEKFPKVRFGPPEICQDTDPEDSSRRLRVGRKRRRGQAAGQRAEETVGAKLGSATWT